MEIFWGYLAGFGWLLVTHIDLQLEKKAEGAEQLSLSLTMEARDKGVNVNSNNDNYNYDNSWIRLHPSTPQLEALMTFLRDRSLTRQDWIFYADRVTRLMIEHSLNCLPVDPIQVTTPLNHTYDGVQFRRGIVGVSVLRAGQSMETALRTCCRGVRIGKILIQRDEETAKPRVYLSKLPKDIEERYVLCMDPMLATGGSALSAIEELIKAGAKEEHIVFVSILAAPEGLKKIHEARPKVIITTAQIDKGLDEKKYIVVRNFNVLVLNLLSLLSEFIGMYRTDSFILCV